MNRPTVPTLSQPCPMGRGRVREGPSQLFPMSLYMGQWDGTAPGWDSDHGNPVVQGGDLVTAEDVVR